MSELLQLNLDVIGVKPGEYVEILVSDEEIQKIGQAGFSIEVVHQNMVAHLRAGLSGVTNFGDYHTMGELYVAMDSIHAAFPGITTERDSIGYTIEGRAIYAMKISDNPEVDEAEPEIFYNALTHAREPMGMEVLLYYMHYLTDNYGSDARVDSIVNNREMWFVPLVNPDGYEYNLSTEPFGGGLWRKNRVNNGNGTYGVDLNRNYGYQWGYDNIGSSSGTSSQTYRGVGPFSEPETQGMREFVMDHDFVIIINYHTYSDLLLYPWGFTSKLPPDRLYFADLADTATTYNNYIWGPGYSTI
ncbi:MAG: M14 family metallopeptidase, partial [candidate division Zixibacteria bacterium]|nr:M14 family metallopeptidase [candidate division Zixibacteria bacterium]